MNILDNGAPAHLINKNGSSPIVLVCEHASCHIPAVLEDLGLDAEDRTAHIAWDSLRQPNFPYESDEAPWSEDAFVVAIEEGSTMIRLAP